MRSLNSYIGLLKQGSYRKQRMKNKNNRSFYFHLDFNSACSACSDVWMFCSVKSQEILYKYRETYIQIYKEYPSILLNKILSRIYSAIISTK